MSRTKIAFKNVSVSILAQIFNLLLSFASRTIFIHYLGNDYLSCEGLLSNVLTLLSFTELGIGGAIIQSLYKPCAEKDYEKIGQLLNLFSKAYIVIAVTISVLGISVFPLVSHLRGDLSITNSEFLIIYFLFLTNTVCSYVCGYKRTFLIADQRNYVVSIVQQVIIIAKTLMQIGLLVFIRNYYLYLIIAIITTIANNVICNIITNKNYPQLLQYKNCKLPKSERKSIFKNIFSIFQYKVGSVILNGSDNIIISSMLKTTLVGMLSNYNMIVLALQSIMNQAFASVQATVGNHVVSENKEQQFHVFNILWLISFWVIGFIAIEVLLLITPFIGKVWLSGEYVLTFDSVFAIVLSFYVLMINSIPSTYRTATGYFNEAKWCPILAAGINIVLSILLAKVWGLAGILFATAFSRLITFNLIDPYLVFKKHFNRSPKAFFIKNLLAFLLVACNFVATSFLSSFIEVSGILSFAAKLIVSALCCNVIFLLFLSRDKHFKDVLTYIKSFLKRG